MKKSPILLNITLLGLSFGIPLVLWLNGLLFIKAFVVCVVIIFIAGLAEPFLKRMLFKCDGK